MRNNLDIEIFADGASLNSIETFNVNPLIKGFTTNPTLMKKDGVKDYKEHSLKIAKLVNPKPVSFEVFSDDFDEMYDWVQRSRFDRLGIFTYSHEENTHAYNFKDDVPEEVKKERADTIMDLQSGISHELNQKRVGQELKVLFDRTEGGYFVGRTEFDSPEVDNEVLVSMKDEYIRLGDFTKVIIEKADHYDLYGRALPMKY